MPDAGALYLGMQVGTEELTPRLRLVSAAYAYKADTAGFALAGAGSDDAWTHGAPDSVLFTAHLLGLAKGGAGNVLHGSGRPSHVNFGVGCTTGAAGFNHSHCTVSGGLENCAGALYATVAGGDRNAALGGARRAQGGAPDRQGCVELGPDGPVCPCRLPAVPV